MHFAGDEKSRTRKPVIAAATFPNMAAKTESAPVSLRPMSLRPGGGSSRNPFERFAKGAGAFTEKAQVNFKCIDFLSNLEIAS